MLNGLLKNRDVQFVFVLLQFVRLRNCLMTAFGVVLGASLAYGGDSILPLSSPVLSAALAAALIAGGGNALNDYFDFEIDKVNKPNRPLPSGRISKSDALMFSMSLFLLGVALAKSVNFFTLVLAAANSILLIIYARHSKKLFLLSNIMISYLVASVFVYGILSIWDPSKPFDLGSYRLAWILAACSFFMTLSREIIKDIEDVEGDKKMYARTLPIVYGSGRSRVVASVFAVAAVVLSIAPVFFADSGLSLLLYVPLILVADLFFLLAVTMYAPLAQVTMAVGMNIALAAFFLGSIVTRI
jgi:geranylgeranylglycerol-phosphate geranylgeranyltransferase